MTLKFSAFRKVYTAADYAEASALWCELRDERGFGASRLSGVDLYRDREVVATISYNGKVWPPKRWEPGDEPLFDPAA